MERKLIEKFFTDKEDYLNFLISKKLRIIANDEGTCFAQLSKEGGYFSYTLNWRKDGKYIGDYVKPFRATDENVEIFNRGCKILAERLWVYIDTNDVSAIPSEPPAFGVLTHVIYNNQVT